MGSLSGSDCYAILGGRLIANLSPSAASFISTVPSSKNNSDSGELSRSFIDVHRLFRVSTLDQFLGEPVFLGALP